MNPVFCPNTNTGRSKTGRKEALSDRNYTANISCAVKIVSLYTPRRYMGEAEIRLHSFLNWVLNGTE
jgi:hypothetical protein